VTLGLGRESTGQRRVKRKKKVWMDEIAIFGTSDLEPEPQVTGQVQHPSMGHGMGTGLFRARPGEVLEQP